MCQYCIPFSKSIKSQLIPAVEVQAALYPILKEHQITTVRAAISRCSQSRTVSHSQRASNQLAEHVCSGTVSHSQRASNHNGADGSGLGVITVSILKRHQITTRMVTDRGRLLYPILKEHQITTPRSACAWQAQTVSHSQKASNHNAREARAVTYGLTVSHSQRASNHNRRTIPCATAPAVSHSQRSIEITTLRVERAEIVRLYPILKEHQITTRPTHV